MWQSMPEQSPLDDPEKAAFAWARYRRLMIFMGAVTLVTVAGALVLLSQLVGQTSVHFYIATGLAIACSMLLTSALMGLVFLSNGTGHDQSVSDPLDRER